MKYLLFMLIIACKLQPFSSPKEGELIVPTNDYHGVDFYLQIEDGVVLVKEKDERTVALNIHDMKLRPLQHSYAVSRDDDAQLIDNIDNVIMDGYQGVPHLFYLAEIKFSITPKASEPYVYTCTFSNVVLGEVKFQLAANQQQTTATRTANGCSSNHDEVAREKLIVEKCSDYAQINTMTSRSQLRYQSTDINAGKVFGEGDVYIFKRTDKRSCEQYVIFDSAAADYMKTHALTCTDRMIKTPRMGNKFLIYACLGVDVIFFSGQSDSTLKVVAKYRDKRSDDNGSYFAGLVATIKSDGTFKHTDNQAIRISSAP